MNCPHCNTVVPTDREICPNIKCYKPIKTIPVPKGGKIHFGGYDWYVLNKLDNRMLIITETVILKRIYHSKPEKITWETCDMRKYLNGEFYNSFSTSERERIIEVVNENSENPWYGTNGGNATTDKIFLLSIEECVKYFGDSGELKVKRKPGKNSWCKDEFYPWIYDEYSLNRRAVDSSGMVVSWRLRSPGANGRLVAFVMGNCGDEYDHGGLNVSGGGRDLIDGHFYFDRSDVLDVMGDSNGIRPALWLRANEAL